MRKEKENKGVEREIRVNLDFLNFIKSIVDSKMEIGESNKESIVKKYGEVVSLRFSNIERVYKRNNRKELIELRNEILSKIGVDIKVYEKVSKEIVDLSKERSSNYIGVKIYK